MLLISIVLGLLPLAGIAWIIIAGSMTSIDGLFMSLILLTLSGVFFMNVFLELRDQGLIGKHKRSSSQAPPPSKPD